MQVRVKPALQPLHNVEDLFVDAVVDLQGLTAGSCRHLRRVPIHDVKLLVQLQDVLGRFYSLPRLLITYRLVILAREDACCPVLFSIS